MPVFLGYFVGIPNGCGVVVVLSARGIAAVGFVRPRYVVDGNLVVVVVSLFIRNFPVFFCFVLLNFFVRVIVLFQCMGTQLVGYTVSLKEEKQKEKKSKIKKIKKNKNFFFHREHEFCGEW